MRLAIQLMGHLYNLLTQAILRILPRALLSETLEAKKRSLAIDRTLEQDAISLRHHYNVLPLGETHVIRDLIEDLRSHNNRTGLAENVRLDHRHNIYQSVVTCVKQLIEVVDEQAGGGDQVECDKEHYKHMFHQLKHSPPESENLNERNGRTITKLWKATAIKTAFKSRCAAEWVDSATYFFNNILRLTAPNYVPTETDIFHSRKGFRSGITELRFSLPDISLNILDVRLGGERRKWLHQCDDVPVLLFVANLCTYDKVLSGANTLEDMVMVFETVVNRERWREATFLVVLSGVSEFRRKLEGAAFREYFPDLDGEKYDGDEFERVERYLVRRFREVGKRGTWVRVAFVDSCDQGIVRLVGNAMLDKLRMRKI